MQKYGMIVNGELVITGEATEGSKPVVHEEIPEEFDQISHYVIQQSPVDLGSHIFMGIEIREVETEDTEELFN
jgi:hypothetical protein